MELALTGKKLILLVETLTTCFGNTASKSYVLLVHPSRYMLLSYIKAIHSIGETL